MDRMIPEKRSKKLINLSNSVSYPDPGGQKDPQKKEKIYKKFMFLKCWMFSFEG
jgi:hypothetical protein